MSGEGRPVAVVGAGLAGSEAAALLAGRGHAVRLYEQKPLHRSPAHVADTFAELVCSNTFRSDELDTGPGILKAELRLAGSLIVAAADATRIAGGSALAVDRERFSAHVTERVRALPGVQVVPRQVASLAELDEPHVIVAAGPLMADALAADLGARVGQGHLAFYDAIAPIVDGDSLDLGRVFFASRYGKGDPQGYANCPMTEEQYHAFVAALTEADALTARAFEDERYFDGCQPVERIAEGGIESLAHGPMRPVGLTPPDGSRPYAVVQLRREDADGRAWNLVGFQTRLRQPDQARIFRLIPGLEAARFLRFGSIHRNTFVDHPVVAGADLTLKAEPRARLAGQITGVEGYIESTASGWLAGWALACQLEGRPFVPPPPTTTLGGLYRHVTTPAKRFQPTNAHLGLLDAIPWRRGVKKPQRRFEYGERAVADFGAWLASAR